MMVMLLPMGAILASGGAFAGEDAAATRSNVTVVQQLVTDAVTTILASASMRGGDTVSLILPAGDNRWLFDAPCAARLKASGLTVMTQPESTATRINIGMAVADVRYGEMFHDGLFGTHRVERAARVGLSGTITRDHELLWSGTIDTVARDTVDAGEIARLEEGAPASLRDMPPDETFFDRIVEPFVILGATGAAVYLLFHVRS